MKPFPGPKPEIAAPELEVEQTEEHGEGRKSSAGSHIKPGDLVAPSTSVTVRELDQNSCDNGITPTVQDDRTSSSVSVKLEDLDTVISTLVTERELYRRSCNNSLTADESPYRGIYWPTVYKMVGCFAFGFICSIAHGAYYGSLNGKQVGSPNHQQWALRAGNIFAFLVQTSLVLSVRYSYSQWLWKTLKNTKISVKALDAAFGADSSPHSFLNKEMREKMRVATLIAIIAQIIPVLSLFAPPTLSINPGPHDYNTTQQVTSLDMSALGPSLNMGQPWQYAVWVNNTNNYSQILTGPRTIIQRLAVAAAATGNILPINTLFTNSTYQLQFHGPKVECEYADADSQQAQAMDILIQDQISAPGASSVIHEINYFAFVPVNSSTNSTSILGYPISAILGNRAEQPANATNQLWLAFSIYNNGSSCQNPSNIYRQHMVCSLYSAFYTVNFTFENGIQTINYSNYSQLGEVTYPIVNASAPSNLTQFAYSAYFWAFTNQIIGSMGLATEKLANGSAGDNFSQIQTDLQNTILLGSSDIDVFFDREHLWTGGSPECSPTGQRAQDIGLARNEPLIILIPELSFNTTMSFFTNELLSPLAETDVTITSIVNYYSYHWPFLVGSYVLANSLAFLTIILGWRAFRQNGVSHDRSFSSILSSTRDYGLSSIFRTQEVLGRLPLPEAVSATLLIFVAMGEGGGLGLRLA